MNMPEQITFTWSYVCLNNMGIEGCSICDCIYLNMLLLLLMMMMMMMFGISYSALQ